MQEAPNWRGKRAFAARETPETEKTGLAGGGSSLLRTSLSHQFPANRENYRESSRFLHDSTTLAVDSAAVFKDLQQNSLRIGTGNLTTAYRALRGANREVCSHARPRQTALVERTGRCLGYLPGEVPDRSRAGPRSIDRSTHGRREQDCDRKRSRDDRVRRTGSVVRDRSTQELRRVMGRAA
jgi:hypothetical protein